MGRESHNPSTAETALLKKPGGSAPHCGEEAALQAAGQGLSSRQPLLGHLFSQAVPITALVSWEAL